MINKDEKASVMLVQKHQLDSADAKITEIDAVLDSLLIDQNNSDANLDSMLESMSDLLNESGIVFDEHEQNVDSSLDAYVADTKGIVLQKNNLIQMLSTIDIGDDTDWNEYINSINKYAGEHDIDLTSDPYNQLLSLSQKVNIEKRIKDEFTHKNANCDKYDYLIAGTCGVIGGLIDVFLVGAPGEGKLTQLADGAVDKSVEAFAKANGWKGTRGDGDTTKSAIGYLERNYKINYDQATTNGKNGTGGAVDNLSASNHHLKSLGHSPDLLGLFFSILNQFTDTSTFVSNGKIITIDTETYELKGTNFVSKVFSGFVNWIGHLFSDMAGSSGANGRGAGIPIPFYNLLLLLDVGEFGKHKQTFATIATKVFEKGYDFRHGLAMAVPVLVTELLTRLMWVIKKRFYHKEPWKNCIPRASEPELRRMLLVAHGSLCLIDAGDAAIKSGGEIVQFLLRTNIIGWVRFGNLAYKEVLAWHKSGHIDHDAVDDYLKNEYIKMLK